MRWPWTKSPSCSQISLAWARGGCWVVLAKTSWTIVRWSVFTLDQSYWTTKEREWWEWFFICSHLSFVFLFFFHLGPILLDHQGERTMRRMFFNCSHLSFVFLTLDQYWTLRREVWEGFVFICWQRSQLLLYCFKLQVCTGVSTTFLLGRSVGSWEDNNNFSFWCLCVSEWISSWETYWRPVNCKPSHRTSGYKIRGLITWLSFNPYLSFVETYIITVIRII